MKRITSILVFFIACFGLMAQSNFKVDPAHSSVNFKIKHNGISFVQGRFDTFDGAIVGSPAQFESARVFFNVKTESINTGIAARDSHLRSNDFFGVEQFPTMTFESTGIEKVEVNMYKLHGKLQIKDVVKDVTFDVDYGGAVKKEGGSEVIGFTAKNTINRFEYNVGEDAEGSSIGKDVFITLYLEFSNK